ncbi:MAG: DUF2680 domain-containing protein [Bacteriovoracaceae bacterium]|jgi:hypothetical protein|nr:DUF2680 domain-containing protein [Bacteriovoracaceae bacterium]
MKVMTSLVKFMCSSFLLIQLCSAETPSSIAGLVEGMKLDKPKMRKMIDILVQTGKITNAQAESAKKELEKMDDKKLQEIKEKAVNRLDNGMHKIPDMRNKTSEVPKKEDENKKKTGEAQKNSTSSDPDKKPKVNLIETLDYLNN